ncbi:MAG: efflux transporter outer membrane subunit [Gammaproteobacteria bacterium]|nr:efflux transporter outer membrane subunit [Gammaproteobacteria bacterium]
MKSSKPIKLLVMGSLFILMQACAPTASLKKPEVDLPKQYVSGAKDDANTAAIQWKDFFEDPALLRLIETAVSNNKEVNIMLQRMYIAQNEIQERKGEYLPFVSVGVGAEVENVGHYTINGAAEETLHIIEEEEIPQYLANYEFGVSASWEIDVWKKLRNSAQVAALEYMASKEGRNFLVTNLVAEIAHSYYELVALDNQLVNLDQNIQLQEKGIEVIKQLKQYGRANLLAIKRLQGEMSKNKAEMYEIMQEIIEVENKINVLLGRTPQPIQRSSGGFLNFRPKMIQAGIPSQLLQNRPDIRQAELELTAADLNIDVAKANFYPSLEIKAWYGYQAFQTAYLFSPESAALLLAGEIVAPIFNRSAILANYKNADARQIQAAYEYEQKVINAYTEVANNISSLGNLEKQYQLKNEQVRALTESIELVNQLFKSARAEYLEVLLTQREALEANMELIEIKRKQISGTVDLYRTLGGGWN